VGKIARRLEQVFVASEGSLRLRLSRVQFGDPGRDPGCLREFVEGR